MKRGGIYITAMLLALVANGCVRGTRPDDMSAVEHEAASARAEKRADDVLAQSGAGGTISSTEGLIPPDYSQADMSYYIYRDHAEKHAAAAAALRAFEAQECAGVAPEIRAQCPMKNVRAVEAMSDGVVLWFKQDVNVLEAESLMKCHIAFARVQGRQGMDDCPLYLPGLTLSRLQDGTLKLSAEDAETSEALKQRVQRGIVSPEDRRSSTGE